MMEPGSSREPSQTSGTDFGTSPRGPMRLAPAVKSFPHPARAHAFQSKSPTPDSPMSPPETRPIRLLIVDDHKVVRLGLHTLLSRHAGIEVVGEAGTVASAVQETARLLPDVVLMDVRLPDGNGFEACRQIRRSQIETRVLFLTSFADEEIVLESIDAGG